MIKEPIRDKYGDIVHECDFCDNEINNCYENEYCDNCCFEFHNEEWHPKNQDI